MWNECCQFILLCLGSSSYADYIFQTSSPPFGGQCEIAPINGTSLDTQFTVVCFNWTSPTTGAGDSGGFNYKIYARRSASNDEYELIVDGPVQLQRMLLPSGLESAHYGVDLLVKVVDFIGLYSSFGMMAYVSLPILVLFLFTCFYLLIRRVGTP